MSPPEPTCSVRLTLIYRSDPEITTGSPHGFPTVTEPFAEENVPLCGMSIAVTSHLSISPAVVSSHPTPTAATASLDNMRSICWTAGLICASTKRKQLLFRSHNPCLSRLGTFHTIQGLVNGHIQRWRPDREASVDLRLQEGLASMQPGRSGWQLSSIDLLHSLLYSVAWHDHGRTILSHADDMLARSSCMGTIHCR